MRALVADRSAVSGVSLVEAPDAVSGPTRPSEALIEVHAVSLNRGEDRRLPAREEGTIPGWDVAGVTAVRALEVGGALLGRRVLITGVVRNAT